MRYHRVSHMGTTLATAQQTGVRIEEIHPDSNLDDSARRLVNRYLARARSLDQSLKVGDLIVVEDGGVDRLFRIERIVGNQAVVGPAQNNISWRGYLLMLAIAGAMGIAWLSWPAVRELF